MPKTGIHGLIQRQQATRRPAERSMFRRALSNLQGRTVALTDEKDISEVLARLSYTPDGTAFLEWIRQQSYGHTPSQDASEGALRDAAALNRFATKIFNLLDRGLIRNGSD